MKLVELWPPQSNVDDVLKGDADGQHHAVLMAVHQPMRILRRPYHQGREAVVNEASVLNALQSATPDGCLLLLIEGAPGTGKSHLVRWIHQRLKATPLDARRVTLLVPKGTSLRRIINELLDRPELQGERNADLRSRLGTAREPISNQHAADRLCGELGTECARRAQELKDLSLQRGLTGEEERDQGWLELLPHLVVNAELRGHLIGTDGPVLRLVRHLSAVTPGREAVEKPEFVSDDLKWPAAMGVNAGRSARQALQLLESSEERSRAARLLNLALDDAKRVVLGLDPSVVGDVFRAIRAALQEQDRELVLLVEDFADLSGLQRQLLQVAIQQATDGTTAQPLCTLRTVLAYTTDYIKSADAAFQRAGVVYVIPDEEGTPEKVLERSDRLVASYLDAARLGRAHLIAAYDRHDGEGEWLPAVTCDDDAVEVAEAFGKIDGHYLFPFTREVIHKLIGEELRNASQFNPRLVIRGVMPRVLAHREAFLAGEFPSKAFEAPQGTQVLSDVDRDWLPRWTDVDDRERWGRALLYWNHISRTELARAFRLPQGGAPLRTPPPPSKRSERPKPPDARDAERTVAPTAPPSAWLEQRKRCEQWASGSGTPFDSLGKRRELRDAIGMALRTAAAASWQPRAEWRTEEFAGTGRFAKWTERIRIPRVAADELSGDAATIEVVAETDLADAVRQSTVAMEVAAVAFIGKHKQDWSFEGAEEIAVAYLAFVERNVPELEGLLGGYWRGPQFEMLPWVATALDRSARALGVEGLDGRDPGTWVGALLEPLEARETGGDGDWNIKVVAPLRNARGARNDAPLRAALVNTAGAFQGSGTTPHALDAARLRASLPNDETARTTALRALPRPAPTEPQLRAAPVLGLAVQLGRIFEELPQRGSEEWEHRRLLLARLRALAGAGFTTEDLVKACREALVACSTWIQSSDAEEVTRALDILQHSKLASALSRAEKRPEAVPDAIEELLRLLSSDADSIAVLRANEPHINTLARWIERLEQALSQDGVPDPLQEAQAAHEARVVELALQLDLPAAEVSNG